MGWFIPALIGGAVSYFSNKASEKSKPKPPEKMSYEDALTQAEDALRNPYEENRKNVLNDINRNMVSKGFYGQAPGDYLTQDAMTDMANDYETQKSRYAQNLRNNDYAESYQKYQTELQQANQPDPFWSAIGTMAGGWAGSEGGSDLITSWLTG